LKDNSFWEVKLNQESGGLSICDAAVTGPALNWLCIISSYRAEGLQRENITN
jgi:hypothetical protein